MSDVGGTGPDSTGIEAMTDEDVPPEYPGARPPDRLRTVDSAGLTIQVHEWGDEAAPAILLTHGGFDFARTFSVFAPLLADGGLRAVAWDQRGHGDSQHAPLYSWDADVRDAVAVLDSIGSDPIPILGHSKGGNLMLQLADACPHRVSYLVNFDGLPGNWAAPDVSDHERSRMREEEIRNWLDRRRRAADASRRPGTLSELARRRADMNPRLSFEWLRYLAGVGARRDPDGWRWKIDPTLRMGGFGPWRPDWALHRLSALGMPLLGIVGLQPEQMGMGVTPESIQAYLPPAARLVAFEDTGHFLHIEQPRRAADLVLEALR
ncbi:MAG: alpha/beta fold hydrolase [Acidimicrobiales bacterium]